MHDIVTGKNTARAAREDYAKEFADYRCKKPAPYMECLRQTRQRGGGRYGQPHAVG